ncbi:PAS domain-containing protein [Sphingomonas naphthae]|uniref:PAS domain-containing protein n=1 Tax=Sphingomonas naphthae TaxID=1813468 RepID=A0ABY7TPR0_9SPHN|nr:PAS domain-containing protein [Sphingomonas naphthae]WCT75103.1 PAS domain-containing protein [Sphingomonas naphthae]
MTHHGRERLVILSVSNYSQLSQRAVQADRAIVEPSSIRLGSVLDRLVQGFMAVDRNLVVTELNPAGASYLKLARQKVVGSTLADLFTDFGRTLLNTFIVRAVQSGESAVFDQPSLTFEGRWLRFETMPYLDGAAILFRDVTEEKAQRARAEEETAMAAAAAAHSGVGRGRLSPRGTFVSVDATLARLAGFEPEALYRARLTDILPLARRVDAAHRIEAVLGGGAAQSFTTALTVNGGGERPVRIALAELRGEHASDGAVVIVTPE